jgi:hypothetical protein
MTRGGMTRSYGPAKGRGEGAGRNAVTWAEGDRLEIPRQSSCQLGDIPITSPPPSPRDNGDDDVTTMMMTTIPFWISVVDGCTFRYGVGGSYVLWPMTDVSRLSDQRERGSA